MLGLFPITAKPIFLIDSINKLVTFEIFKIEYLSFNSLITHLVAKIICLRMVIGIATSLVTPPNLRGNNRTSGVIFVIATKNTNKGS
jgi:hypothetical protein